MLYLMNNVEEIKEMKRFDWFIVNLAIIREAQCTDSEPTLTEDIR